MFGDKEAVKEKFWPRMESATQGELQVLAVETDGRMGFSNHIRRFCPLTCKIRPARAVRFWVMLLQTAFASRQQAFFGAVNKKLRRARSK